VPVGEPPHAPLHKLQRSQHRLATLVRWIEIKRTGYPTGQRALYPFPVSLLFANQITALATAVLAVFAIVTAAFAILAFRKQSSEVRDQASMLEVQAKQLDEQVRLNAKHIEVLKLQAIQLERSTEVLQYQAELARRAQATRVFITLGPARLVDEVVDMLPLRGRRDIKLIATVQNTSDQPIYGAEISWNLGTVVNGESKPLGVMLPGAEVSGEHLFPHDADMTSGADVTFTDASGVRWRRRLDGELNEF
jgi:hypothetical protein